MLAQFQTRYPTGSLISELLTIYQGKFIVRVSAQVEGINRATGMAAAETLELAEDRARERAIAVLVNEQTSTPPEATVDVISTEEVGESKRLSQSRKHRDDFIAQTHNQAATTALNDLDVFVSATPDPVTSSDTANERDSQDLSLNDFATTSLDLEPAELAFDFETTPEIPTSSDKSAISFSNVTPLVPRSYNSADATASETIAKTKEVGAKPVSQSREHSDDFTVATSEPIDLSDAIARTNVELKRLEWSNQDGRKYLEKTYGKRSRQHLTDQELLEFLHYLESLPSP